MLVSNQLVNNHIGSASASKQGHSTGQTSISQALDSKENGLPIVRGFGSLLSPKSTSDKDATPASLLDEALVENEITDGALLTQYVTPPAQSFGSAGASNAALDAEALSKSTSPMLAQLSGSQRSFGEVNPQLTNSPAQSTAKEAALPTGLLQTSATQTELSGKSLATDIANLLSANQTQNGAAALPTGSQAGAPSVNPTTTVNTAAATTEWAPVRIDPQAGKWGEQMLQVLNDRVTLQAQQNLQEARIRLDPPDLGKLDLMVRVEGDKLSVQLNANVAATREALVQVSERLRAELQNQSLMHVDVQIGGGDKQESNGQPAPEQSSTIFANERHESGSNNATAFSTDEHWLSTQV
ncbi:flagellar hook-length control protein FliK [Vibrio sp. DNB22_10_4]